MNSTLRSIQALSLIFLSMLSSVSSYAENPPVDLSMIHEEIQVLKEDLGEHGDYEMPVHEFNLKAMLERMMDQCPSPMVKHCYAKLEKDVTLSLSELLEVMPELVNFAYEQYPQDEAARAPRPDAPSSSANDAVVGKNGCDLTQVLALLSLIKKRIDMLRIIICEKFNGTFTTLEFICEKIETLTGDISVDFNGVFTTLDFVCEKIETLSNNLACLQDIPIDGPTTITLPGSYCLIQDVNGSIIIDSDSVILNLNNHEISGATNNIEILSGHSEIFIKNGVIRNAANNGILIEEDASNIEINNVDFIGNSTGVNLAGTMANNVSLIKFQTLKFIENTNRAIQGSYVANSSIYNVIFQGNLGTRVIDINNARSLSLLNVLVNNNSSGSSLSPIYITDSSNTAILHTQVHENTAETSLIGIELTNDQNTKVAESTVHGNTLTGDCTGILTGTSRDIKIFECYINQNVSSGGNNVGIDSNNVQKLLVTNVQVNNNVCGPVSNCFGFNAENSCSDCTYLNSNALVNGGGVDTAGFRCIDSTKSIYKECLSNDNVATNTAVGFELQNTGTSCILACIAKRNTGSADTGRGIYLLDCPSCSVENNLVAANTGAIFNAGIEVSNTGGAGTLQTSVFENQSSDHGAFNYIINPGDILRIIVTRATASVSATPTPLDNFDIV